MAKGGNQTPYFEGQTIQWPKKKTNNGGHNTIQKTKHCATRTPFKRGCA